VYYKDLLRFRGAWLGAALIWIILYHLPFDLGPVNFLRAIGYGGVDICFFASGIGCYYSLSSRPDCISFMKRRIKRLIPTYLIFILVWLAFKLVEGGFGLRMAVGNLLALQHFTGHGESFNWYIGTSFLFYILAPYFKGIIDRACTPLRVLFIVFLFACSVPFWGAETYIIVVSRLPVFYIGMLFGRLCREDRQISRGHAFMMVASFIFGTAFLVLSILLAPQYVWSHGLFWYTFIFITVPLCTAMSAVFRALEKTKITAPVVSFLFLCGDYSLELYLVHLLLVSCIPFVIERLELQSLAPIAWAVGLLLLIVGCFALRRIVSLCLRLLFRGGKAEG